jgi:hypothetical protein
MKFFYKENGVHVERHCTQIFTKIKKKGKVYAIILALAIQVNFAGENRATQFIQ